MNLRCPRNAVEIVLKKAWRIAEVTRLVLEALVSLLLAPYHRCTMEEHHTERDACPDEVKDFAVAHEINDSDAAKFELGRQCDMQYKAKNTHSQLPQQAMSSVFPPSETMNRHFNGDRGIVNKGPSPRLRVSCSHDRNGRIIVISADGTSNEFGEKVT